MFDFNGDLGGLGITFGISKSLGIELSTLQSLFSSILAYLYTFVFLAQMLHFPYHTNLFTCFQKLNSYQSEYYDWNVVH